MARVLLVIAFSLSAVGLTLAADPKPLWEIDLAGGDKATTPAWVSFAPNGKLVVAVTIRESGNPPDYQYTLRVWDAETRTQRFTADLGTGKVLGFGDPLAGFDSDESVLTGGSAIVSRDLTNGNQLNNRPTGGPADHAVWTVPDLRETYHLRRDAERFGQPPELFHRSNVSQFNEFSGRRAMTRDSLRQLPLTPPRPGLRPECVVLNPARSGLFVSYRDDAPTSSQPRHCFVLYRIITMEDYRLDELATVVNPHPGSVTAAAFAPNGRILATGGDDGSITLWDLSNPTSGLKPMATVEGVSSFRVFALAFRPDWRVLAAITWDRSRPNLLLIDVDSGKLIGSVRLERELLAVAWSPDGRTLLTAGASGKVQAWDAEGLRSR